MRSLLTRDERETQIDDSADRVAYLVLSYGLLAVVAYRGFVERTASWELLALVVLGGFVGTAYRLRAGAVSGRWLTVTFITLAVAAIVAAVLAVVRA